MRAFAILALFVCPSFAEDAAGQTRATLQFLTTLQNPNGSFAGSPKDAKASLRSTNAAVRAFKYLTGKATPEAVPNVKETAAFVVSCYDPKTGGFADSPGGKPDVALTAVGVMAAVELEIPKEKFAKAMDYLKENAKTFEDVRIGAAAVEAWGVNNCPFKLEPWFEIAGKELQLWTTSPPTSKENHIPRALGSYYAFELRLGKKFEAKKAGEKWLGDTQWSEGGWGAFEGKKCDLETTYRVMRAMYLLKEKPADIAKLRAFIAACRNKDGGFGVQPGQPSTASGVYFAAIITKWLDELEKK